MVSFKSIFLFTTTALAAAAPQSASPAQISGFKLVYSDLQALDLSVKHCSVEIHGKI
jgi:hypothetical protein